MARTVIVKNQNDDDSSALAWVVVFMVLALGAYLVFGDRGPATTVRSVMTETVPATTSDLNVTVNRD